MSSDRRERGARRRRVLRALDGGPRDPERDDARAGGTRDPERDDDPAGGTGDPAREEQKFADSTDPPGPDCPDRSVDAGEDAGLALARAPVWHCSDCAATYADPPEECRTCGAVAFERGERR